MKYIILIFLVIFAISLIVVLLKYVLFHPRTNSVLSLIFLVFFLVELWKKEATTVDNEIMFRFSVFVSLLFLIPIIDCIRDIIIAPRYYSDIEDSLDVLYVIKSLTSFFTGGLARIIFLLVVDPLLGFSTAYSIKKEIAGGHKLQGSFHRNRILRRAKKYHFDKQVARLEKRGIVVSNKETVDCEQEKCRKKLEELYPQKIMDKVVETVAGDKKIKESRKRAERSLRELPYAYIGNATFEKLPYIITEAMSIRGVCSLLEIKYFKELETLNIIEPRKGDEYDERLERTNRWFDFFIIKALQPLVMSGAFEDDDFNDKDALDNHAYRYVKSVVSMPSIEADNDPRFALDDE